MKTTKRDITEHKDYKFCVERLEKELANQTKLVAYLLGKYIFEYSDIYNEYEDGEQKEIFQWLHYPDTSDYVLEKLNESDIPYIKNNYGLWIGRTSFGQAWEYDIIRDLIHAFGWLDN